MRIWRITKARYLKSAFSGMGAEKVPGRWNHAGSKMVYAPSTLSLASLELFVHLEPLLIPDDLYSVSAVIPDRVAVEHVPLATLPTDWQAYPGPTSLREIGTQWLHELRTYILIVPSAVNPEEHNVLLNPLHPDSSSITEIISKPFQFDPRMW